MHADLEESIVKLRIASLRVFQATIRWRAVSIRLVDEAEKACMLPPVVLVAKGTQSADLVNGNSDEGLRLFASRCKPLTDHLGIARRRNGSDRRWLVLLSA